MNENNCGTKKLLSSGLFFTLAIALTVTSVLSLISYALNPNSIELTLQTLQMQLPEWLSVHALMVVSIIAEIVMLVGLWLVHLGASGNGYKITRAGFMLIKIVLYFYVVLTIAGFIFTVGWQLFQDETFKILFGAPEISQRLAILFLFLLILWVIAVVFAIICAYFIYSEQIVSKVDSAYSKYSNFKISAIYYYIFVVIAPVLILFGAFTIALGCANDEISAELIISSIGNIVAGVAYFLIIALIKKYNKSVTDLGESNGGALQSNGAVSDGAMQEANSEQLSASAQEDAKCGEEILLAEAEGEESNSVNENLPSPTPCVSEKEGANQLTENKTTKKLSTFKLATFVTVITVLVVVLVAVIVALNIHPNEFVSDGVVYKLDAESETYSVVGYKAHRIPKDGVVEIEADRFGYAVVSIEEYAFFQCSEITGVIIPEGVEEIDSYAFTTCQNLRYVVMPSTIEIMHQWTVTNNPNVNVYLQKESVLWSEDWWFGSFDGDVYYLGQWHYNSDGVPVPN